MQGPRTVNSSKFMAVLGFAFCHRIRGAEAGPRRGHAGVLRAPRHPRRRQVLPFPLGKVGRARTRDQSSPGRWFEATSKKLRRPSLEAKATIFLQTYTFFLICPSVPTHWCPYGDPRRLLIRKRLPHDQAPTATSRDPP